MSVSRPTTGTEAIAASSHALSDNEADPSRMLLLTRFESQEHAEAFSATGLLDELNDRIVSCAESGPYQEVYDLYYAVGSGGHRVVFGEESILS